MVVGCIPLKSTANWLSSISTDGPSTGQARFQRTEEAEYHANYRRSYFGLTRKKAGWDCMRHIEILAAGCVPLFVDLAIAPAGSLGLLPKDMLGEALRLPGVQVDCPPEGPKSEADVTVRINPDEFSYARYLNLAKRLLKFTASHLTSTAVARFPPPGD